MKRFITIVSLIVPILAIGVLSYSLVPGFSNVPYVGSGVRSVKKHVGIVVLFKKDNGLFEIPVVYRYYADGTWHDYEELQEELFDDYCKTGNYASLKHCWLDGMLKVDVYRMSGDNEVEKIKQSKSYHILKKHIALFHCNNKETDSVEFSFYTPKIIDVKERELILTFKDTL